MELHKPLKSSGTGTGRSHQAGAITAALWAHCQLERRLRQGGGRQLGQMAGVQRGLPSERGGDGGPAPLRRSPRPVTAR